MIWLRRPYLPDTVISELSKDGDFEVGVSTE